MQEQTPETLTPDGDLKDDKVRPKSKVKVVFINSKHHAVPNVIEEIHPALAAKLLEAGKIEMATKAGLSKAQKEANKEHIRMKAADRGRVANVNEEDEDGDLIDNKVPGKKSSKTKEEEL